MEALEAFVIAGSLVSFAVLAYGAEICARWLSGEYTAAEHRAAADLALFVGRSHGRDWGVHAH
jgi:hypothetical protein